MTLTRTGLRYLGAAAVWGALAAPGCSSGGGGGGAGGAGASGGATGGAGTSGDAGTMGTAGVATAGTTGTAGASGTAGALGGAGGSGVAGTTGTAGASGGAGAAGADGGTTDAATDLGATEGGASGPLALTSTAFAEGATIPNTYTCAGGTDMHMSPPLAWTGQPAGTKGWAIVLEDTTNMFTHWAIWDIQPTAMALAAGVPVSTHTPADPASAKQVGGNNQSMGYISPCPPTGQTHTYVFTLYAQSALPLANVMTTQTADVIATQLAKQNVGTTMLTSKVTH